MKVKRIIAKDEAEAYEKKGWKVGKDEATGKIYAEIDGKEREITLDEVEAYEKKGWKATKKSDGKIYAYFPKEYYDVVNKQQKKQDNTQSNNNTKTTIPPIPFKNQKDGDAFREWVHANHPEYIKKVPGFKKSYKEFNNKAIQNAWNLFYKEYQNKGTTDGSKSTTTDGSKSTTTDGSKSTTTDGAACLTWFQSNPFIERYKGREAAKKAAEFIDWFIDKYSRFYGNLKNSYDKKRECRVDDMDHYLLTPSLHKHGFIKFVAEKLNSNNKPYFEEWYEDSEGNYPYYSERYDKPKDETKQKQYDQVQQTKDLAAKVASEYTMSSLLQKLISDAKTIRTTKIENLDRGDCRDYLENYLKQSQSIIDRNYLGNDEYKKIIEINRLKDAAKMCDSNFSYLFGKTVKILKSNVTDKLFQINENNMKKSNSNLLSLVKENLNNEKLKKEIRSELYKSKYSYITENFERKNYKKVFDYIFENKNFGILSESNEEFDKAFKSLFYKNEEKVKKQATDYVLSKLNVSPSISSAIKTELMSIPNSEVDNMLTTPSYLSDKIVQGILKSIVYDDSNSDLDSILKSTMIKGLKTNMDEVKFRIGTALKDVLQQVQDNIVATSKEFKNNIVKSATEKI